MVLNRVLFKNREETHGLLKGLVNNRKFKAEFLNN